MKTFIHFGQTIKAKQFQQYDYGKKLNQKLYGSGSPPQLDLTLVPKQSDVPIAMFAGEIDALATPPDSIQTYVSIKDNVEMFNWVPGGHVSFLVGKDMTWFQEDAMAFIKKH